MCNNSQVNTVRKMKHNSVTQVDVYVPMVVQGQWCQNTVESNCILGRTDREVRAVVDDVIRRIK